MLLRSAKSMLTVGFQSLLGRFHEKRFGVMGLFWLSIAIFLQTTWPVVSYDIVGAFKTDKG